MEEPIRKSRQEIRSEETKSSIREAAGKLFTSRGYDAVTMREIAKEAGCSHTTIYLYYKDKEALLETLAIPPLMTLEQTMLNIINHNEMEALDALKELSRQFLRFSLTHKSMVPVIFNMKAGRVDEVNPQSEVNKHRNQIFAYLSEALNRIIEAEGTEQKTNDARILFYMLYGIVHTYLSNEEPIEELLERIVPILDEGVEMVILGMLKKHKLEEKLSKKRKNKNGRNAQ
ncbi:MULTISPECIES: TetR/AcrR family transcriptional regulator [unclassified Paenibacillus]|uniref:TetR/AcrR family transcriptional regulator n=1 Tax=unclassified Paenibacillus TaxID=185978 RepID=UPI0015C48632|nr:MULTISPECIES: TetR/AcrR family transcriptional regulator [unclassified Paenibacillus]MBE1446574.1 AcrR family transcriptional regulator [Paenibacillus sp. OAS669]